MRRRSAAISLIGLASKRGLFEHRQLHDEALLKMSASRRSITPPRAISIAIHVAPGHIADIRGWSYNRGNLGFDISDPLEQQADPLPYADAHEGHCVATTCTMKFLDRTHRDPRTRHA